MSGCKISNHIMVGNFSAARKNIFRATRGGRLLENQESDTLDGFRPPGGGWNPGCGALLINVFFGQRKMRPLAILPVNAYGFLRLGAPAPPGVPGPQIRGFRAPRGAPGGRAQPPRNRGGDRRLFRSRPDPEEGSSPLNLRFGVILLKRVF